LSLDGFVSVFSHVWVFHDVISFEFTIVLGLKERAICVFGNLSVTGLLKSMVVNEIIKGLWTFVNNILSIFKSHSESRVNLFFIKVKWIKTGWDRSSWGDNVSESGFLVSEFGSQETVHGVIEGRDFEVSEKHTNRFIVFSLDLFKVSSRSHDNININLLFSETEVFA